MWYVYFDASALAKRYVVEIGTPVVAHIAAVTPLKRWVVLNVGVGEIVSVIVRHRTAGRITGPEYAVARANFHADVIATGAVKRIDVDSDQVDASFEWIDRHSINATDALVLQTAQELTVSMPAGRGLVLVTSDQRLLTAAQAEGVRTFDLATQTAADFDALLAGPP